MNILREVIPCGATSVMRQEDKLQSTVESLGTWIWNQFDGIQIYLLMVQTPTSHLAFHLLPKTQFPYLQHGYNKYLPKAIIKAINKYLIFSFWAHVKIKLSHPN